MFVFVRKCLNVFVYVYLFVLAKISLIIKVIDETSSNCTYPTYTVVAPYTLSRSILYYMEIVGNYQNSAP